MVSCKYIFKGRNLEPKLAGFIREYFASAYESNYPGGFLRVYEDGGFFSKKSYIVIIRLDSSASEENIIRLEVIVSGGKENIIIDDIWGGDAKRTKSFSRALQDFCKEQFINYESE